MISYLEKGVKYTGNNGKERKGQPYLLSSCHEINLLANSMERRLGLRYTTLLNNYHRHTKGDNAVCLSTVYLAYKRLKNEVNKDISLSHITFSVLFVYYKREEV